MGGFKYIITFRTWFDEQTLRNHPKLKERLTKDLKDYLKEPFDVRFYNDNEISIFLNDNLDLDFINRVLSELPNMSGNVNIKMPDVFS